MKRAFRILSVALLVILWSGVAAAQGTLEFARLGDFRLEDGETLRNCRIAYRTFGTLNKERSNAVLFPSWFAGTSQDLVSLDLIGPGRLADTSRFFVIAVDALGNGVSSSPSNSRMQPGRKFPRFSIRDMVNCQYELLTRHLGITHLEAVMGISMGGMQAFQWMLSYPDFMEKTVSIVGSPLPTSFDHLIIHAELNLLETMGEGKDGGLTTMRTLTPIHIIAQRTPSFFVENIPVGQLAAYIASTQEAVTRSNIHDWTWQLKAIARHDVFHSFGGSPENAAASVKSRVLVVTSRQDHMVNPASANDFAKTLGARTLELTGNCGHLAFLCENDTLIEAVSRFMTEK
jgi:homoserine O-acetyltransferase